MRLIDADALMLPFNDWWYSSFGQEETERSLTIKEAMKAIEDAPTIDAEPVTRCADCVAGLEYNGQLLCIKDYWSGYPRKPEDFCSGAIPKPMQEGGKP